MEKPWHQLGEDVVVDASARLHLGFLDMSGSLGRRFGSLGLSIDAYRTRLRMRTAGDVRASGPGADRAARFAHRLVGDLGIARGVDIRIESAIPDHLGLGSGTQMALAVGRAVAALHGLELSTREIAARLQRGKRSGIGIGAFDRGGFLLDSGVGEDGSIPSVTSRLPFPDPWRVLLVMDARGQGLHGSEEAAAMNGLPPFPREIAAHLCHLTLMQILPGLREQRLEPVAAGIAELQRHVGDHFAPAQGGRFTSKAVADALTFAESLGHTGVGQSSWGPTGFVLLPHQAAAEELVAAVRRRFGQLSPLRFVITAACNRGGRVQFDPTAGAVKEGS